MGGHPLDEAVARARGVLNHNEAAHIGQPRWRRRQDQHVSGGERRQHAAAGDPEDALSQRQSSVARAHPPASTQSTWRPLVAQKMSWISLMASMSSSALALTSTLQALQSLAAFQKVSWRLG